MRPSKNSVESLVRIVTVNARERLLSVFAGVA